jgi:hypothetical protein
VFEQKPRNRVFRYWITFCDTFCQIFERAFRRMNQKTRFLSRFRFKALWKQHPTWIAVLVTGTLLAACYAFALQLPFFFDDLPVFTWLRQNTWLDVWLGSTENDYYRPLTFTVYKLGLLFPQGTRQVVLHGANLLLHWASALLIVQIVRLGNHGRGQALLASVLFVVFPFAALAVPWVTAMPHHLVTALTALAVFAALKAERDDRPAWWALSFLAAVLAPFAHESGQACGIILAGIVLIQHGFRAGRRRVVAAVLSVGLSAGVFLLRGLLPASAGKAQLDGLSTWFSNGMFFLHGLIYPATPAIGWLVHRHGANDFLLVQVGAVVFALAAIWLSHRQRDWRSTASGIWWWGCAALPAAVALKYGRLYISPRLYALASVGIVMLWANVVIALGQAIRTSWGQRLLQIALAGVIVAQSIACIYRQRELFTSLDSTYQTVLEAARDGKNTPLGFVNLPAWLAVPEQTYALVHEGVVFVPPYSNVGEFIEVNAAWREADAVMYPPVLQEADLAYGFMGGGLDWEQMRQFAIDHRSVWLTRYADGRFDLQNAGTITPNASPASGEPLARFEGGPVIESASVQVLGEHHWAVTITWLAPGPVQGKTFVHIRDADGNLVAQADGPALGGMVPPWIWQPGDRIQDVRHIVLPGGTGPYTVQVGLFHEGVRFPAFMDGVRCLEDAAPIAVLE